MSAQSLAGVLAAIVRRGAVGSRLAGAVACGLMVGAAVPAAAQGTGSIRGQVIDQTGGALPGVTIEVETGGGSATAITTPTGGIASNVSPLERRK